MAVTDFRNTVKLNQIPVVGLVPESSSAGPASPVNGQLWWDTVNLYLKFSSGGVWKNPLSRSDHVGTQPSSTISDLATVVQAYRLDQFATPTNPLNVNSQRITSLATPTSSTDAATKQYVDNARAGINVKDPVRAVAQSNVNLASLPATIDGVTMNVNDRFLVVAQTTGTQNGIYSYSGSGTSASYAYDVNATGDVVNGTLVAVAGGSSADQQWIQTANPSGAPGAWTQTWVRFSSGGQTYSAGNGLAQSSNTFSVLPDPAGPVAVSGSGVSLSTVPIAFGGTGGTSASAARTNLGTVGKFSANVGALTGGSALNITHGLNTTDILEPSLKEISSGNLVGASFSTVDANTVSVTVAASYAANTYRITVVG